MRKPTVLHVTPSFAPAYVLGGPVVSLEGLTLGLRRANVDVRVLTTDCGGVARLSVPTGWTEWKGIPVKYVPRWLEPDITPRFFAEALKEVEGSSVVHVTGLFSVPSVFGLLAARVKGLPVVWSPRGVLAGAAFGSKRSAAKVLWLAGFKRLVSRGVVVHATSSREKEDVLRIFGVATQTVVIPNGVDLGEPPPGSHAGRFTIGVLGRIHPIKNLELIVAVAKLLEQSGNDFCVRVAGPVEDQNYFEKISSEVAARGLSHRFEFVGSVYGGDKRRFLEGCSVLVLASHSENFGNVVIESLAASVPVVATKGTPWEALDRTGAGRWVDATQEAVAGALLDYMGDPGRARTDGSRGRAWVEKRYSWELVSREMLGVYESLARAHLSRSGR